MRIALISLLLIGFSQLWGQAFYEDFESGVPGQFTQTYVNGSLSWATNGGNTGGVTFPFAGSNSASFYISSYYGYVTELESPDIDLSGGGDFDLSFQLVQKVWLGDQNTMEVQISTNGGTNWSTLANYTNSIADWTKYTIDLDAAASLTSTTRIKFIATNAYGYSTGLDEIRISCPSISPSVASIGTTSATISLGNTPASWDLAYGAAGFSLGTGTQQTSLTGSTYTINSLSSITEYEFYVRQSCDANWDGPYSFATSTSSFPYFERFDGSVDGWSSSGDFTWLANTVTQPNGSSGTAYYCDFYGNASGTASFYTPVFDLRALTNPVATFYIAHCSYSDSYDDELEIYISDDGGLTWTASPVWQANNLGTPSLATRANQTSRFDPTSTSEWRHQSIDLSSYSSDSSVQIRFDGISAYGNDLHIDDFKIENASSIYTATISATGSHSLNGITINFTDIGSGGELLIVRHDNDPTNLNPTVLLQMQQQQRTITPSTLRMI
jgi:hypothetical protein